MATSSKKSGAAGKKASGARGYDRNAGYVRLRTILDSLEIGALRYYLDHTDTAEKKKRLELLETDLMPIVTKLWGGKGLAIDCPEGYTNCNGCCVPYSCLDRSSS
jgi:hypothetical protein